MLELVEADRMFENSCAVSRAGNSLLQQKETMVHPFQEDGNSGDSGAHLGRLQFPAALAAQCGHVTALYQRIQWRN